MQKLRGRCGLLFFVLLIGQSCFAQVDSIATVIKDSIVSKLIVDDIPKKTFKDKFMYPHRWYVKQLLSPKVTDFDTTYIKSNKRKLTITFPVAKKFYGATINDLTEKRKLEFSPNTYYNVGFNFSNIILTFGFYPGIRFGSKADHGQTHSRDLQVTLIGRRIITDINYQNYRSFYVHNSEDFFLNSTTPDSIIIRPDVKVVSFGVNTMYVYNYKKYSLRGAFSFTDVQLKSAGSFMTGFYHSNVLFTAGDSSFVKGILINSFFPLLSKINKISMFTIGVNAGYGYTFVYKRFVYCLVGNVGIGGQKTDYSTLDEVNHKLSINFASHLNGKTSLRYDNQSFFIGLLANYDRNFTFNSHLFNTENYIARVVGFVGYRFNIRQNGRKVLKAMGLVDYN